MRLLAAFAFVLLVPASAAAVEKQVHVGASAGLSVLKVDDKSTASVGAGGGVDFRYGLNDAFNVHVEGQHSVVALDEKRDAPDTPRTRPSGVTSVAAGAAYVIDIVQIVPYVGLLGGGYLLSGGTLDQSKVLPGAQLAVGLDYYMSRSWAVGLAFRQHMLLAETSTYPTFSTVNARVELTWW